MVKVHFSRCYPAVVGQNRATGLHQGLGGLGLENLDHPLGDRRCILGIDQQGLVGRRNSVKAFSSAREFFLDSIPPTIK